jgi:hypothetical protein
MVGLAHLCLRFEDRQRWFVAANYPGCLPRYLDLGIVASCLAWFPPTNVTFAPTVSSRGSRNYPSPWIQPLPTLPVFLRKLALASHLHVQLGRLVTPSSRLVLQEVAAWKQWPYIVSCSEYLPKCLGWEICDSIAFS